MLKIGSALDVGRQREGKANQDNLAVVKKGWLSKRPPLLVLADGMGGYNGGEIAARLVVQEMSAAWRKAPARQEPLKTLKAGVNQAHAAIKAAASKKDELSHMGSTVVAGVIQDGFLYITNVGDSRAYLINQHEIRLVSHDHSFVADQVRAGLITPLEALTHPKRNVLSMSLTARRESVEPYLTKMPFGEEDILLLCSDGLWGPVPEAIIQAVVLEQPPQEAAQKLVDLANANQGPDNISVIIACHQRQGRTAEDNDSDLEDTQP
jgi:serine/threonine protein phosphatase PrpC